MKNRSAFAALILTLVLAAPALGGIIHSDAPAPAPTPAPVTEQQPTADGIIHSDAPGTAEPAMEIALNLLQVVLSLF